MATLTVGRVCMKTAGREAGRYCVILKKLDNNFFLITGPKVLNGVKRRRCNVDHLEPTEYSVKIEAEASDNEVIKAYEKAGLLKKLGLKKPSPEVMKEVEKKEESMKPEEKEEAKRKVEKKEEKKSEEKKKSAISIRIPTIRREKPGEKKGVKKPVEKKKVEDKEKIKKATKKAKAKKGVKKKKG